MNKFVKVLLAILAAVERTFFIASPILVCILWVSLIGREDWSSPLFYLVGSLASIFRAIKVGWIRKNE